METRTRSSLAPGQTSTQYTGPSMWDMVSAPARAMTAMSSQQNMESLGLMGKIHQAIDPVQAMGGYGNMAAMALPMGAATPKPVRAYHGTSAPDFARFDLNKARPSEQGVFLTEDPSMASAFSQLRSKKGSRVIPADVDLSNSVTVDLAKIAGKPLHYQNRIVSTAIDSARKAGKDSVVIKGMIEDDGHKGSQIIMLNAKGKVKNALTGETMFGAAGAAGLGTILERALSDDKQSGS